ncbi:DUF2953 domain-containing protein [Paraliobacillus salinarum]|uniref:DUF2953 domain-containing protein n=1 Tax=Paraliobacillus salinarum TaxID=1158996 RepID=UPI0015F441BE|nr:DUF2953 domain-containing protein [Paraliobacillus salinarum]
MLIIIVIILLILIVLSLAMLLRVKLRCELIYDQGVRVLIQVTIAQIPLTTFDRTWDVPTEDDLDETDQLIHQSNEQLLKIKEKTNLKNRKTKISKYLKKVSLEIESWETTIGTKNAAATGMLTGACWAIKGSVLAMLEQLFHITDQPSMQIHADFEKPILKSMCTCIFSLRLGQAIYTYRQVNKSIKARNV